MGQTEDLKNRTKQFALRIVRLSQRLGSSREARVIGNQVLRSGTSVGANYRAACRARSKQEFIAKMGIVVEEADETVFWLELIVAAGLMPCTRMQPLTLEASELLAIFAASQRTAKHALRAKRKQSSMIQSSIVNPVHQ